jgi:hypothetical protein
MRRDGATLLLDRAVVGHDIGTMVAHWFAPLHRRIDRRSDERILKQR